MRKISFLQILVFLVFYFSAMIAGILTAYGVTGLIPLGDFHAITVTFFAVVFFFVYLIALYRIFMKFWPLPCGVMKKGTREEFIYHVYILFFIMGFYSLIRSQFLPLPILRMVYLALGARLDDNTYTSGVIFDPLFITVGSNCSLGHNSTLVPHAIENDNLSHEPIVIGNNSTIGVNAVILQKVTIGNNVVVAANSVVSKGTVIGDNEIWGGIPARLLSKKD